MGIARLLHSSFCFLNINTAITRQLIRKARKLEAEWWQVCGEAWLRGQKKTNQVLGAFGLLDFTMLRSVLAWRGFLNLWTVCFSNFPIFFEGRGAAANRGYWIRGYGGPPVTLYYLMSLTFPCVTVTWNILYCALYRIAFLGISNPKQWWPDSWITVR